MTTYYRHAHGCGSGCTKSFIKFDNNKITLVLNSDWMGNNKVHYTFEGEYLPIAKPYGIVQLNSCVNNVTNEEFKRSICFDTYIFDSPLETEWYQHQDKYSIGLYCGGGNYSNNTFQLQLYLNTKIEDRSFDNLDKFVKMINGLKYEICTEEDYVTMKKY